MKISQLKELVRQVVKEENDYQQLFKHMLDRTGKSIPDMSDDEKVKFFQAVDKAAKAKNEGKLKGLPEKFIQERDKITLKYPDVVPILEYATNREYRKKISNLFKSRCIEENTPLVEKVLDLRVKIAELFGFENYDCVPDV